MNPRDILFFQILAGLFVLSFMAMALMAWRFLRGLEAARSELLAMAARMEREMEPILSDMQIASAEFRLLGERARRGSDRLLELGGQLGQLASFGKTSARGIWALLAQTASAFLSK